jgi:ABC-type polysaccharide/polyol phosphate transport system ATPase subunit
MTPAIELIHVTKRYRGGGRRGVELGSLIGGERRRRPERREPLDELDPGDDLQDDDDLEEDVEDEPERPDRDIVALQNVSLEVAPGTLLGLIGPNGAGKTTLLRIVTRLTPPTDGRVVVRGRVAPFLPILSGMMLSGATLRHNVGHVAAFYGIPKDVAVARTDAIAALAELEDRLDDRLTWLSPGELQRFAFAVALELEPDTFVADERITVGDREFQKRCLDHVRAKAAAGMTVLFASHQLHLIRDLCTEAILMDAGRIVERGPVDAVVDAYEQSGVRPTGTRAEREGAVTAMGARPDTAGAIVSAGAFSAIGRPASTLEADAGALLEVVLEVPEAPASLRCSFTLDGSHSTDRAAQPAPFTVSVPGRYVVSAYVPPGAVEPGSYRIGVTAVEYTGEGRRVVGMLKEAFTLDILGASRSGDATDHDQSAQIPAKRRLDLRWGVSQLVTSA